MTDMQSLVPEHIGSREIAAIGEPHSGGQDKLDLSGSFAFFWRRGPLILAIAAAVVVVALVLSLVMPKTYRAEAGVMLTSNASAVGQADPTQAGQAAVSNQVVDTQVEIITSRDMASRVAGVLGMDKGLSAEEKRAVIDNLQRHVSAERTGESYAITITYDAATPEAAARTVNTFAQQFTEWELRSDQERNSEARKEVEAGLSRLRAQAQADTQALQHYRIANNLLSTTGASLTEQEISNYDQEVARSRAQAAEDEARLQTALGQLRSGSSGDDVGEALGSQVISALRAQEAQIAGQVANLSSRYGSNHPELIRTKSQLAEVRAEIQSEIGRVVSNLRARAEVSEQRLASLESTLGSARAKLSQNNAAMVGLSELERNAEASQAIYETYLNNYKQLVAAKGSERPSAKILTAAGEPEKPVSPNLKLNLALAVVIGLGLGTIVGYIVEALSQGLTTPDEVEGATGQRFLASIPLLESVGSGQVHAVSALRNEPFSVFTEAFRSLGVAVDQAVPGGAQVVAVTSALPGEGKTVISCCLSHVYATSGLRTILIDCDLRRRGISRLLNAHANQNGLIEVLEGTATLNFDHTEDGLVFWTLPVVESAADSEHLLTGQHFVDLIAQLRTQFDRIVLDLPPVLPVAYTRTLASRADGVIVAAHWRKTPAMALRAALRRLPQDQVKIAGVALSQVDLRRRAFFGRLDPAFYYKQYREYYS
ncbi:MAG: GumC family protein [Novosphingobium sp.]